MNLTESLRQIVGETAVLDAADVTTRSAGYLRPDNPKAAALVRPANTDEVSQVLRWCFANNVGVVTHGGLTDLVHGGDTKPNEIILSLECMRAIENIDPLRRTATVQAGVVLQALQEAVERLDLAFPLDLGARGSATLGGTLSAFEVMWNSFYHLVTTAPAKGQPPIAQDFPYAIGCRLWCLLVAARRRRTGDARRVAGGVRHLAADQRNGELRRKSPHGAARGDRRTQAVDLRAPRRWQPARDRPGQNAGQHGVAAEDRGAGLFTACCLRWLGIGRARQKGLPEGQSQRNRDRADAHPEGGTRPHGHSQSRQDSQSES